MKSRLLLLFLLSAQLSLLAPSVAFADYSIDTLGTTGGNSQFASLVVGDLAQSFTAVGTDVLTSADVSFTVNAGAGQSIKLLLQADTAGQPSGVTLDTSTTVGVQADCTARVTATFSGNVPLTNGTTYWVVLTTATANSATDNNSGCGDTDTYAGGTQLRFLTGTGWSDQSIDARMVLHFTTATPLATPVFTQSVFFSLFSGSFLLQLGSMFLF